MYYTLAAMLFCATALTIVIANGTPATPAAEAAAPVFNDIGELERPAGFRRWIFVGAPLTPNALNGGAAGFPEIHNVYIEPGAYDKFVASGTWPEGTMIARELQLTLPGDARNGSREEASGRGYFPGAFNGLDVSVKDMQRFPDTNGWGFFSFGLREPPYAGYAAEAPVAACAGCHIASAHDDMVFSGFYRQLEIPLDDRRSPMQE